MKKDHNIQDELQELSPLLAGLKQQEEGYKVPHLYFESLQDKVLRQVNEVPQEAGLFARFGWMRNLAMAASVAVLLLVGVFLLQHSEGTQVADLEHVSTDVLAMYLDENVEDWDWDLLVEDDLQLDLSNGLNWDSDEWGDYIEEEFLDDDLNELLL